MSTTTSAYRATPIEVPLADQLPEPTNSANNAPLSKKASVTASGLYAFSPNNNNGSNNNNGNNNNNNTTNYNTVDTKLRTEQSSSAFYLASPSDPVAPAAPSHLYTDVDFNSTASLTSSNDNANNNANNTTERRHLYGMYVKDGDELPSVRRTASSSSTSIAYGDDDHMVRTDSKQTIVLQRQRSEGVTNSAIPAATTDWNEQFQAMRDDKSLPTAERLEQLSRLVQRFTETAETYASIIISERCLPMHEKTIKPLNSLGGLAGGEKYSVQGILFKFALDTEIAPGMWMYGGPKASHHAAMKAAQRELVAVEFTHVTQTSGLHFPLMALVDYKGYRVVAMSVLPIDKSTIVYGSADGGHTVHNSDSVVSDLMQHVASSLNLSNHVVGAAKVNLIGCGDMEIHRGYDGRLYAVDLARLFPPEAPVEDLKQMDLDELSSSGSLSSISSFTSSTSSGSSHQNLTNSARDTTTTTTAATTTTTTTTATTNGTGTASRGRRNSTRRRALSLSLTSSASSLVPELSRSASEHIDQLEMGVKQRGVFYNLMRPEFVTNYVRDELKISLCSDAFTAWDKYDPNRKQHMDDVTKATRALMDVLVPRAALELSQRFQQLLTPSSKAHRTILWGEHSRREDVTTVLSKIDVKGTLHHHGVNMRHLGLVIAQLPAGQKVLKRFLMALLLARVWKTKLKDEMRAQMDRVHIPAEEPFRDLAVRVLNEAAVMCGAETDCFWKTVVAGHASATSEAPLACNQTWRQELKAYILVNFKGLPEKELEDKKLRKLCTRVTIMELARIAGIQVREAAWKALFKRPKRFWFSHADIEHMYPTVRQTYLNLFFDALGRFLRYKELADPFAQKQTLKDTVCSLERAMHRIPVCPVNHFFMANAYYEMAMLPQKSFDKVELHFKSAFEHFNIAHKISCTMSQTWEAPATNWSAAMLDFSRMLAKHGQKKRGRELQTNARQLLTTVENTPQTNPLLMILASLHTKEPVFSESANEKCRLRNTAERFKMAVASLKEKQRCL